MEHRLTHRLRLSVRPGHGLVIGKRYVRKTHAVVCAVEIILCLRKRRRLQHLLKRSDLVIQLRQRRQKAEGFQQRRTDRKRQTEREDEISERRPTTEHKPTPHR